MQSTALVLWVRALAGSARVGEVKKKNKQPPGVRWCQGCNLGPLVAWGVGLGWNMGLWGHSMVCICKDIANCPKKPQFLPVNCALCPRCAGCALHRRPPDSAEHSGIDLLSQDSRDVAQYLHGPEQHMTQKPQQSSTKIPPVSQVLGLWSLIFATFARRCIYYFVLR